MVQLLIELSAVAWGNTGAPTELDDPVAADQGPFGSLTEEFLLADAPTSTAVTTRKAAQMAGPTSDERTFIVRAEAPSDRSPAPIELPPLPGLRGGELRLAQPLTARLRDLSPLELDVLQAVLCYGSTARIESTMGDGPHPIRSVLSALIARGYVVED